MSKFPNTPQHKAETDAAVSIQTERATLADVLTQLENDKTLSDTRRRDLRSAVSSVARLVDRSPDAMNADWPALRRRLDQLSPAQAGVSMKRMQNIRSDLRAVLKMTGGLSSPSRGQPRSPEWEVCYQLLSTKRMKNGLSGFIRYCDITGVAPGQVDDRSADAYIEYLEREGARSRPRDVHRRTCKLWNEAAETVPHWPQQAITIPEYRAQPWTVSWDSLPESFRQDVDQHLDWLGGKILLADNLPPTVCKGSTLNLRRRHLHGLISAAIHSGVPIETLTTLSELIDPDVVRKAMMYFLDRNEQQPTQYHRDLVGTVISIARHWVQADAQTLDALKEMRKRLSTRPEYGLTQKNRDALRQFESPENVARLLNLPDGLVKKATRLKSNERQAVQVQLALAVELLLMAPMRIGNLVSLRLDQHIQRPQGKRGPVFIVLNEAEVKNNLVQEYELPTVTVQLLDNYLQNYRPYLVDSDSPWLFPGGKGGHKLAATLSAQIQKVVYKETGLTLTAHQFRHLAAKFFLDASPGSYETVRRVLGHRNIKTTTNFYTGMETRAAVKQYDQAILGLREGDATGRSAGRGPSS